MKKLKLIMLVVLILMITACGENEQKQIAEQLELGQKYLSELNYEQAIIAFQKVIELDPKNVEAYLQLSDVFADQGDLEAAIEILEAGHSQVQDEQLQFQLAEFRQLLEETVPEPEWEEETEQDETIKEEFEDEEDEMIPDETEAEPEEPESESESESVPESESMQETQAAQVDSAVFNQVQYDTYKAYSTQPADQLSEEFAWHDTSNVWDSNSQIYYDGSGQIPEDAWFDTIGYGIVDWSGKPADNNVIVIDEGYSERYVYARLGNIVGASNSVTLRELEQKNPDLNFQVRADDFSTDMYTNFLLEARKADGEVVFTMNICQGSWAGDGSNQYTYHEGYSVSPFAEMSIDELNGQMSELLASYPDRFSAQDEAEGPVNSLLKNYLMDKPINPKAYACVNDPWG